MRKRSASGTAQTLAWHKALGQGSSSHALDLKLGATLVCECTGASVAKFWPIFPWPHTAFLPYTLGNSSPVSHCDGDSDYYHIPGTFL